MANVVVVIAIATVVDVAVVIAPVLYSSRYSYVLLIRSFIFYSLLFDELSHLWKFRDDLEMKVGFEQGQYEHAAMAADVDPILMHLQMSYLKIHRQMHYMDHHGIMVVVKHKNGQPRTSHVKKSWMRIASTDGIR